LTTPCGDMSPNPDMNRNTLLCILVSTSTGLQPESVTAAAPWIAKKLWRSRNASCGKSGSHLMRTRCHVLPSGGCWPSPQATGSTMTTWCTAWWRAGRATQIPHTTSLTSLRAVGQRAGLITSWGGGAFGFMRSLALIGPLTVPQIAQMRPTSRQRAGGPLRARAVCVRTGGGNQQGWPARRWRRRCRAARGRRRDRCGDIQGGDRRHRSRARERPACTAPDAATAAGARRNRALLAP
jgi:hypothetical protein